MVSSNLVFNFSGSGEYIPLMKYKEWKGKNVGEKTRNSIENSTNILKFDQNKHFNEIHN